MKYLLAIMCGLMALFMGGCAVLALAGGPIAAIPGGLAFLNVAIIGGMFGWKVGWKPAYYILGSIDILVALVTAVAAPSMGSADQPVFWIAAAAFALKGVLSFAYASSLKGPSP